MKDMAYGSSECGAGVGVAPHGAQPKTRSAAAAASLAVGIHVTVMLQVIDEIERLALIEDAPQLVGELASGIDVVQRRLDKLSAKLGVTLGASLALRRLTEGAAA